MDPFLNKFNQIIASKDQNEIIKFVNKEEFLTFLTSLSSKQKLKWDLLDFFLKNPNLDDLKEEFLKNLFYPSGLPLVNLTDFHQKLSITPLSYTENYLNYELKSLNGITNIISIKDGFYKNTLIPITILEDQYYFESQSPFLLFSKLTLVSRNKINACLALAIPFHLILEKLMEKEVPIPLIGSKEEQWTKFILMSKNKEFDPLIFKKEFMNIDDSLTDILIEAALKLKINTIVLKYALTKKICFYSISRN